MAKKISAEEAARNQELLNIHYTNKAIEAESAARASAGATSTVAQIDTHDSSYSSDVNINRYTTQQQYDDGLANAQGKAAEWTNAVIGGVAKVLPTFIEYSANMLDAENLSGDTDYHNVVSDKMRELNRSIDEEIPIYKSSDAGMFSSEALAGTLQGTIASGAAFAALAGITGGVLAAGLGTGAVGSLVTTIAGAALATHAEGVGVAADVYTKGMEMQVNKGLADFRRQHPLATQQELDIEKERLSQNEAFITKAKEGADTAHSINMVNTLLNLTSVARILNPAKFSAQLAKQFTIKELAKDYIKEGSQEALEENINLIAEKKGLALIANKAYGIKNAAETVFSEEGAEAALGGIFGAVIQTGATDIYKGATGVFKEQNERYGQAQQNINALKGFSDGIKKQVAEQDTIANITPKQMSFASFQANAQETAFLHSALTLAEASKDEDLIGFHKNNLLTHHAVEAFKLGNAEAFEEVITQLEKSTPEAKKEITGSEDTESVRKQITDMRRVFKQTQELFDDNVTKISSNLLGEVVKNKSEALEIERLEKQLHFDTKSANAKATLATIESLKAGGTKEDLDTFTKTISAEHAEEIKKFEEKQAKINGLKASNVTDALNLSNGITKKIVRQEEKAAKIEKDKVEQEKINKQVEKTNALLNNKAQKYANVIGNTPEEIEAVSGKLDEEIAKAEASGDTAKAEELTAQKEQVLAKVVELVNKKTPVVKTPVPVVKTPVSTAGGNPVVTKGITTGSLSDNATLSDKEVKLIKRQIETLISRNVSDTDPKVIALQNKLNSVKASPSNKKDFSHLKQYKVFLDGEEFNIVTVNTKITKVKDADSIYELESVVVENSNGDMVTLSPVQLTEALNDYFNQDSDFSEPNLSKEPTELPIMLNIGYGVSVRWDSKTGLIVFVNKKGVVLTSHKDIVKNTKRAFANKAFVNFWFNNVASKKVKRNLNSSAIDVAMISQEYGEKDQHINYVILELMKGVKFSNLSSVSNSDSNSTETKNLIRNWGSLSGISIDAFVSQDLVDYLNVNFSNVEYDQQFLTEKVIELMHQYPSVTKKALSEQSNESAFNDAVSTMSEEFKDNTGLDLMTVLSNDQINEHLIEQYEDYITIDSEDQGSTTSEEDTNSSSETFREGKKLVRAPYSLASPTIKAIPVQNSDEVYNKGATVLGEGLSPEQVQIAENILDNSENSVQAGTVIEIVKGPDYTRPESTIDARFEDVNDLEESALYTATSPEDVDIIKELFNWVRSQVTEKTTYIFKTADGKEIGYLHKPDYIRESRIATSYLFDDIDFSQMTVKEAEFLRESMINDLLLSQIKELRKTTELIENHFNTNPEGKLVASVTSKSTGTLNTKPKYTKLQEETINDPNVTMVVVQPSKNNTDTTFESNTINVDGVEVDKYLAKNHNGVLSENAFEFLYNTRISHPIEVILVPTSVRINDKVVYDVRVVNKTPFKDTTDTFKSLFVNLLTKYLNGSELTSDEQLFISKSLTSDVFLDKTKGGVNSVKIGDTYLNSVAELKGIDFRLSDFKTMLPVGVKPDNELTLNGEVFKVRELYYGNFNSDLLSYGLANGQRGYTNNPVIEYGAILTQNENSETNEDEDSFEMESPLDKNAKPNHILEIQNIGSETSPSFNIVKKEEILKVFTANMIGYIQAGLKNKDGSLKTINEIFEGFKTTLNKAFENETNPEIKENFKFAIDNFNEFKRLTIANIKSHGFAVNVDASSLTTTDTSDELSADVSEDSATPSENMNEEIVTSDKYDRLSFGDNPYTATSAYVKLFFETVGSGEKGVLGGISVYGGAKLFMELLNDLHDSEIEDIDITGLRSKGKPHYLELIKKFEKADFRTKALILASLNQTKSSFVTVTGNKVIDAQRESTEVLLRGKVVEYVKSTYLIEGTGNTNNTLSEEGEDLMSWLNERIEENKPTVSDAESRAILEQLGIFLTDKEWETRKVGFNRFIYPAIKDCIESNLKSKDFSNITLGATLASQLIGSKSKTGFADRLIADSATSFVDGSGNKRFLYGIHHFLSRFLTKMSKGFENTTLLKEYRKMPFMSANTWIHRDGIPSKVHYITDANKEEWESLSVVDKLRAKITMFGYNDKNTDKYKFVAPAHSDKKLQPVLESRKLNAEEAFSNVTKIVQAEALRIIQFAGKKIKNIEGVDGSMFYMFPQLNDKKYTIKINDVDVPLWIEGELNNELFANNSELATAIAKEFILAAADELVKTLGSPSSKYHPNIHPHIVPFVGSEIQNNYNYYSLFAGDPAFFAKGSVSKTMDNLFKRMTKIIATAKQGKGTKVTTSKFVPKKIKIVCLNDTKSIEERTSKNIEQLEAILGDQEGKKNGYRDIELADGIAYPSLREYVNILVNEAEMTEEQGLAIRKAIDDHIATGALMSTLVLPLEQLSFLLTSRKPVTTGFNVETPEGFDTPINRPFYIKYSIFPLLPQIMDSEMLELIDFMEKHNVDRAVMKSAFKTGSPSSLDLDNLKNVDSLASNHILEVDRDDDGTQVQMPYDEGKKEINEGSQAGKNLFDDINDPELEAKFHSLKATILDIQNNEYLEENGISIDEKGNVSIASNKHLQKSLKESFKDELENPNEEGVFDLDPNNNFKIPFFFNKLGSRLEQALLNGFKNKVLKTKLGGRSYTAVSEYGFKGSSSHIIKTSSYDKKTGLKPSRLVKIVDGKEVAPTAEEIKDYFNGNKLNTTLVVKPAQVMIPWNFRDSKGNLLDIKDFMKEDNTIDMSKISEELLTIYGYRIPTQGHNSMSGLEIVGFLPNAFANTIIAPKDLVVQMGMDFDIDKIYTHSFTTHYKSGKLERFNESGTKEKIKNEIVDIYIKMMAKPEVYKQMIQPLDFGLLPEIVEKLQSKDSKQSSILNPITQVTNYENGTAGQKAISMASMLSVFAGLSQKSGLSSKENLRIALTDSDSPVITNTLDKAGTLFDKKRSKSSVIAAFQSAALDNIKELLIKAINYTPDTHPLLVSMSMYGLDEKFIVPMMLLEDLPKKIDQEIYENLYTSYPLTLEMLERVLKGEKSPNARKEAMIIAYYRNHFMGLGTELNNTIQLVNTLSNGTGYSIEDIVRFEKLMKTVYSSELIQGSTLHKLLNHTLWGKSTRFVKQQHGFMSALYPITSSQFIDVNNRLEAIGESTKKYKRVIKDFIKSYHFTSANMFNNDVVNVRRKLMYGKNSLAHRILNLKKSGKYTMFSNSFTFTFDAKSKLQIIKFIKKTRTPVEKYQWQNELIAMYNSSVIAEHLLASDFIKYQYLTGGTYTPISAISMIPPILLEKMGLNNSMSKVDFTTLDDSSSIVNQFVQNNIDTGKIIVEDIPTTLHNFNFKFKNLSNEISKEPDSFSFTDKGLVTTMVIDDKVNPPYPLSDIKPLVRIKGVTYRYTHTVNDKQVYVKLVPAGKFGNVESNSTTNTVESITKDATKAKTSDVVFTKDKLPLRDVLNNMFKLKGEGDVKMTMIKGLIDAMKVFNPSFDMNISVSVEEELKSKKVEVEGLYKSNANGERRIKLNSSLSNADFERAFSHEILHHILSDLLKQYRDPNNTLSPEIKLALNKINRLYEVAKQNSKGLERTNALLNIDEFMSDMLTHKDVQEWANKIPFNNTTMWDKLKDLIIRLFDALAINDISLVHINKDGLLEQFLSETLFLQDALKGKETKVAVTNDVKPTQSSTNVKPKPAKPVNTQLTLMLDFNAPVKEISKPAEVVLKQPETLKSLKRKLENAITRDASNEVIQNLQNQIANFTEVQESPLDKFKPSQKPVDKAVQKAKLESDLYYENEYNKYSKKVFDDNLDKDILSSEEFINFVEEQNSQQMFPLPTKLLLEHFKKCR